MKKVRTKSDIINDQRIEDVFVNDCGITVVCKDGYAFFENQRSICGTVKECCNDINNDLTEYQLSYK